MHLIPMPRMMEVSGSELFLGEITGIQLPAAERGSLLTAAVVLADEIQEQTSCRPRVIPENSPVTGKMVTVKIEPSPETPEHYVLTVSGDGVAICGSDEAGAFYGIQTLRQMIRSEGALLPGVKIDDEPDFPNRGFYHDVTRSKVPTLKTMKALADKLAYYKINQLQLYVEHTFAFAAHTDIWSGTDPMTAEDILELDRYCRERHIELVPSISTFGHFYMILRSKRKEHLNELEIRASEKPFSYYDRQAHYTVDCMNPESYNLVRQILEEYIPLFTSRHFNICCDETEDLGKGRNRAAAEAAGGSGKLYVEFLKKIIGIVAEHGRIPMFWGDVIIKDPDLIRELPQGTIALDWDYSEFVRGAGTEKFHAAGVPFYVCPGVQGWNRPLPNIKVASGNITRSALKGLQLGAVGILNTDWGDMGHINLLGASGFGLALGAAASWNAEAAQNQTRFDQDWSALELGQEDCKFVSLWRKLYEMPIISWNYLTLKFDCGIRFEDYWKMSCFDEYRGSFKATMPEMRKLFPQMMTSLAHVSPLDPLMKQELLVGLRGVMVIHEAFWALEGGEYDRSPWLIADEFRLWERDLCALWLKRSKLSEYGTFRQKMLEITSALDGMKRMVACGDHA